MSRRLVDVTIDGTIFSLRGYRAHGLALAAGLRPTYNGIAGAWVADTNKLPQFTAYLEYRNVAYRVSGPEQVVRDVPPEADVPPGPGGPVADPQLSLFDGSR